MAPARRFFLAGTPAIVIGALLAAPTTAAAAPPPAAAPVVAVTTSSAALAPVRPHTNAELARELARIARSSQGRVSVTSVGTSNEQRPLWLATVGRGSIRVLYVTEQHGDEPLGTESALVALRHLGLRNDADTRRLRARVTLGIVVRANPDGHERNWRFNFDPDAQPEFGQPGQGYDINRYHNPGLLPELNPVPEAAAIQRTWQRFQPAIMVDYHMQGRYLAADGREITASVMWPTTVGTDPAVVNRSKQVTVRVRDAMTRAGAVVSQYPGGDYEGIARNGYGLRGSASVLVELSSLPAERESFQVMTAYVSMVSILRAVANGALDAIDPSRADAIPPRGTPIPGTALEAQPEAA